MKIAIVAEMLVKNGGAERVVKKLLKIYPNADLFTLIYDKKNCEKEFGKYEIKTSFLQKWFSWGIPKQLLLMSYPRAIESFDFTGYDIVISSSSAFAHGIITPTSTKHISYIHAPMRYAWDYTHKYTDEKLNGWKKIFKPFLCSALKKLRIWDFISSGRAEVLIANSKLTQKRIKKYWRKDSIVIYPPVNTKRFTPTKNHEDFYLIVSMLEPFKKIDIVVEAFNKNLKNKRLVIIGEGSQKKYLQLLAKDNKNIQFLDNCNDECVTEYMQKCKAFIFAGIEDFGITPVESMSAGKPVLFFNKGGVAESVINEKTGIAFEKQTPESLKKGLLKLENLYNEIIQNQEIFKNQCDKFSENRFEEEIKKIIIK